MTIKWRDATLALAFVVAAQNSASATVWQQVNAEYLAATAQACQSGIAQGCQRHQQAQIERQAYGELLQQCNFEGAQQACNKLQQLENETNNALRQSLARHRSAPPSPSYGGGQSPGEIYSDILDSSHKSFQERSNITAGSQSKAVDNIWGRNEVTNPYSGDSFIAEGYEGQFWQNDDGQYFGTDDPNFDPNLNPEVFGGGTWNPFYSQ